MAGLQYAIARRSQSWNETFQLKTRCRIFREGEKSWQGTGLSIWSTAFESVFEGCTE